MQNTSQAVKRPFSDFDAEEQAQSINGRIRSLEMAIERHVREANDKQAMGDKCKGQVERLLQRLQTKYP
jgi:hypothetical protein